MPNKGVSRTKHKLAWLFLLLAAGVLPSMASAVPKVIVISLDGATPRLVDEQMQNARAIPVEPRRSSSSRRSGPRRRSMVTATSCRSSF